MAVIKNNAICFVFFALSSITIAQEKWTVRDELDLDGQFIMQRTVDTANKVITFELEVKTHGWVGFGLNTHGDMPGADMVIGGMLENGTHYFSDRHATNQSPPIEDSIQNWDFLSASENDTHTRLSFSRLFDTCDQDGDIAITSNTLSVLWAYGVSDVIQYHEQTRGAVNFNLLDPPQPLPDLSQLSIFPIHVNDVMPEQDTSYWCTLHGTPENITSVHYMVGFEPYLPSDDAFTHTHHFLVYKCVVPKGDETGYDELRNLTGQPGINCEGDSIPEHHPFLKYCRRNALFVWAKGGQRSMFPDNVGLSFGENQANEFYLFEVHYDNPNESKGKQFATGLNIFYTDHRDIEASVFQVEHNIWYVHTIPPNAENFLTPAHCSSECTQDRIPESGIHIFNVLLHSHVSGRKLKLRHFRNGQELPWVLHDDNYDFDFQQNRRLREELHLLPGDELTYECVTDTTWNDGDAVLGGLSTRDEMCQVYLFYYPKINLLSCGSTVWDSDVLEFLGVENITFIEGVSYPIITAPEQYAGKTYLDLVNDMFDWDNGTRRADYQKLVRDSKHLTLCIGQEGDEDYSLGEAGYPKFDWAWEPKNECEDSSSSENLIFKHAFLSLFIVLSATALANKL